MPLSKAHLEGLSSKSSTNWDWLHLHQPQLSSRGNQDFFDFEPVPQNSLLQLNLKDLPFEKFWTLINDLQLAIELSFYPLLRIDV